RVVCGLFPRREAFVVVVAIPIGAPLPDIARHVMKPIAVGWERANGGSRAEAVFRGVLVREAPLPDVGHPFAFGLQFISPRIGLALQPTASGEFEFGLCRQALAGPLGISDGVLPGNLNNGMPGAPPKIAGGSLRVPPVSALHVIPPAEMVVQGNRTFGRRENNRTSHQILRRNAREVLGFWRSLRHGDVARGFDELPERLTGTGGLAHPQTPDPEPGQALRAAPLPT